MTKQRKKIICAVTNDLNNDQRMQRICASLVEFEFDVCLVGRQLPHSKPLSKQPFQQKRLRCWFQKGKLFYVEYNLRLLIYLLTQRVDILNAVDLDTILPCWIVASIRGKKVTYDAHEYFSEVPEVVNRPITKKIWENIAAFCIPKMYQCYTVGPALAQIFESRYGKPFGVVRNVSSSTLLKKEDRSTQTILLYQGALNEGRGLSEIIKAMPLLSSEINLWIAGDGDLADVLRNLVQQLNLESRVIFLGMLAPNDLKQCTTQATVGINLLENKGLSYYYSLSNKTFDYIQAHLPAINIAFPEYIKLNEHYETAVLCGDLTEEAILKAIRKILEPETYKRLQQNCVVAAKDLVWEHEKEHLLKIYADLEA